MSAAIRARPSALCGLALGLGACEALPVSVGSIDGGSRDEGPPEQAVADAAAPSSALYLEAEQGALSGGFSVLADDRASGGEALAAPEDSAADDAPGEARARYTFELARAGDYVIWGRIRSPDAAHNRFWFSLDDAPFVKWRISVGDIWYWDDFHDDTDYGHALQFALATGPHSLELAAAVPGVELDQLYVTADGDVPPGNDTPCSPPHSIELLGSCHASCGAQNGRACGSAACAGREIIAAYDCDVCCLAP